MKQFFFFLSEAFHTFSTILDLFSLRLYCSAFWDGLHWRISV